MNATAAARLFALQAALAAGFAIVGILAGQTGWAAGGAIGVALALMLWGLAKHIEEPEAGQPRHLGTERVITGSVATELAHRPAVSHTVIPGGQMPHWAHRNHRPVWDTDIFGAPE